MAQKIYFDPETGGFLSDAFHAIPAAAVAVSARRHADLLLAQANGATIVADTRGRPRIDMPDVTQRRARLLLAIKAEVQRRILLVAPLWQQIIDMRRPDDAARARFARIDALLDASWVIEAVVPTLASAAVDSFPVTDHPYWPSWDDEA